MGDHTTWAYVLVVFGIWAHQGVIAYFAQILGLLPYVMGYGDTVDFFDTLVSIP